MHVQTITQVAEQCPLQGGDVVYQARNWLMLWKNSVLEFTDNCLVAKSGIQEQEIIHDSIVSTQFKVFPNPNNGRFVLQYNLPQNGKIEITDLSGKQIYSNILLNTQQELEINLPINTSNGIYQLKVNLNQHTMYTTKLVLTQ